jgi:hypothetical protein
MIRKPLLLALALLAPMPVTAQSFNPATFDWIDPANWNTRVDASGVQRWVLNDPAARAYNRKAYQSGQFCVASFMRGNRTINLMIPKISAECQGRSR